MVRRMKFPINVQRMAELLQNLGGEAVTVKSYQKSEPGNNVLQQAPSDFLCLGCTACKSLRPSYERLANIGKFSDGGVWQNPLASIGQDILRD